MISLLDAPLPAELPAPDRTRRISPATWNVLRPRTEVRSFDWCVENLKMPNGARFAPEEFPHAEGVLDALDNPETRRVVLQWGTRLGKTAIGQAFGLKLADTNPVPMMFASSTETLAAENMRAKVYPMIERCRPLADQLPPVNRRTVYRVDLRGCRWYCAWSGSVSMLADRAIFYVHLAEVDKWTENESKEGDPVDLAIERTKEFPMSKILFEGTPTVKGRSRLERERLSGTNRQRYVPCLRCGRYQVLDFGHGDEKEGGVIFDKDNGNLDATLARETARWICPHCHKESHDEDRAEMMRRGQWVTEGCRIDRRGRVTGSPRRSPFKESFQLSSLYSLQLTWGDVAYAWASSYRNPRQRQNVVNGWFAKTFAIARFEQTWEELGNRLTVDEHHVGEVPAECAFVTVGVDRQIDHWVYMVCAWSKWRTHWLVDYGIETEWSALLANVIRRPYDGVLPRLTLVDSRHETDDSKANCAAATRANNWVYALMGVSNLQSARPYERRLLVDPSVPERTKRKLSQRRGMSGHWIVYCVKPWYNEIVDKCYRGTPGEEGSLTLPAEARHDQDLLEQLINETQAGAIDRKGYEKHDWVKIDETIPIDFRDAHRYSMCAADICCRGAWGRVLPRPRHGSTAPSVPANQPTTPTPQAGIRREGKGLRASLRKRT